MEVISKWKSAFKIFTFLLLPVVLNKRTVRVGKKISLVSRKTWVMLYKTFLSLDIPFIFIIDKIWRNLDYYKAMSKTRQIVACISPKLTVILSITGSFDETPASIWRFFWFFLKKLSSHLNFAKWQQFFYYRKSIMNKKGTSLLPKDFWR